MSEIQERCLEALELIKFNKYTPAFDEIKHSLVSLLETLIKQGPLEQEVIDICEAVIDGFHNDLSVN